jgi:hypothetical protein
MEAAADVLINHGVPQRGVRATHKIVFEYADSDDDEGTTAVVEREADALTTNVADMEDPVEAAKLKGIDDDDASSVDLIEDVTAAIPHEETATALYGRSVPLPTDLLPIPRAPDARVRTLRVHRGEAAASARDAIVAREAAAEAIDAAEEEEAAEVREESKERPPWKRDRETKVTSEGYHLTTDERDLVEDKSTGVTRFVQREPRPEFAALFGQGDGEGVTSAAAADDDAEAEVGDDEDEEEEEDEEDGMMDDLLLVAAVEQTMRCCEDELVQLRAEAAAANPDTEDTIEVQRLGAVQQEIEAFTKLVEEGAAIRKRLCDDEITPIEFGLLVRPLMNRVNGALKRAARPPKPAPIIIDGVTMDM